MPVAGDADADALLRVGGEIERADQAVAEEIAERDLVRGSAGLDRLAELEQEVARVKVVMQEQLGQQQGLTTTCNLQKLRVQEVLEFFGREALDRIAQTSVKLLDKLQEP